MFPSFKQFSYESIPVLLPLIQTFLTISIYSVIAIAIQGLNYVLASQRNDTPSGSGDDLGGGGGTIQPDGLHSNYHYSSVDQADLNPQVCVCVPPASYRSVFISSTLSQSMD